MRKGPTTKQLKFIDEYMKDYKAAPAAVRSGYNYWTSDQLMRNPIVRKEIDRRMAIVSEMANVSAAYVLTKLRDVAERCMQGEPVMEFDPEAKEMRPTGEWKFDSAGANKALELLGKKLKLFTDKIEHTADEDTWMLLERFTKVIDKELKK